MEDAGGRTKALEDMRQELHSEWTPVVSSSGKAPLVSVAHSRRSQDHSNIADEQASGEAPFGNTASAIRQASSAGETHLVSVTPSHSRDHLNEEDTPGAGGTPSRQGDGTDGDFIPAFCTPAHGRDRSISDQAPPMPAVPTGSGTGSRRAYRARDRSAGPGTSSSAGMRRHTGKELAPVHASPPPSSSLPIKALNRPPRSTEKKKFSYVGDNTWLKPETDLPETASFPLKQGEVAVASECAIHRKTPSTPPEEAPASIFGRKSKVGTADDTPKLTARRNRYQSPTEIEEQLEQDHDGVGIGENATGHTQVFAAFLCTVLGRDRHNQLSAGWKSTLGLAAVSLSDEAKCTAKRRGIKASRH